MHDVALLSASPEDLFGFTSSFPRLKMLLPWIIHISRTNLLKTSQLLSIASTFFHSTQCIPFCSYLSNSSPHTWLLWWNEHSEGKKPLFWKENLQSYFTEPLPSLWKTRPCEIPAKAGALCRWGWGGTAVELSTEAFERKIWCFLLWLLLCIYPLYTLLLQTSVCKFISVMHF